MKQSIKSYFLPVSLTLSSLILHTGPSYAGDLKFSNSVTAEQSAALNADLALDWTLPADSSMDLTLGVSNLSNASIKKFISDRIHYVIGETEDIQQNIGVVQDNYVYQSPGIFPNIEKPEVLPPPPPPPPPPPGTPQPPQDAPMVIMSNVGTAFYYIGKENNVLVGYHFVSSTDDEIVSVKSPYAGILRIGAGLFMITMGNPDVSAKSNSIFRVGTLLHESHHSDGNATSLGFPHAVCPKGHPYYNHNACDRNGNGPYTAGAQFVKNARLNCMADKSCSPGEAEILAIVALDSFSRVLDKTVVDAKPEGL